MAGKRTPTEGIELTPLDRGLSTPDPISSLAQASTAQIRQEGEVSTPKDELPLTITDIISFQSGELIVKKSDGKTYRRAGGTMAWRNQNPGNLKYGAFAKSTGALGAGQGGHAVYPTPEAGEEAQRKLLFTDVRDYFNRTLLEAIKKYAPTDDPHANNEPKKYAAYVASHAGTTTDTRLSAMDAETQHKVLLAMRAYEGYKTGTETLVG